MAIAEVRAHVVSEALEQPFFFSQSRYDQRTICLVQVVDDGGQVGWGEGYGPAGPVRASVEFLARRIEEHDVGWFEEPLSPDDLEGFRWLHEQTRVPLATGECECLRAGFRRLLESGGVDVVQPDLCHAGGLTETRRIVDMAETFAATTRPTAGARPSPWPRPCISWPAATPPPAACAPPSR